MNKLYEVLELCLQEIEQGVDVNTVLSRYPEMADELRPMLEASVKARAMAVPAPSQEVIRRNRAKLLQHAAELRERKAAPSARRIWSVPLRRALVSFMMVVMLFVSGTGLVSASSTTLPGDNLYPVKRVWEGVSLLFTFDMNLREALELEHEHERLEELQELFTKGRSADVKFAGYVTRQGATEWRVAGVTVSISPETVLPNSSVNVGAAVRITGVVQNGIVIAERIELLAPGSIVPDVPDVDDDESEFEEEKPEELDDEHEEDSGSGSKPEATAVPVVKTPTKFKPENVSLEGVVTSVKNNLIVINGIAMDIRLAEIKGTLNVGSVAKVEGYYDVNGIFIVTKIEFKSDGLNGGDGSEDDNSSNDNSNDSNENDNDDNNNDDDDDNKNDDDDDDNSGSSGGGDNGDDDD